jgi:membrane-bound metal-dependent hydrolase YbcI (DUF457 family)
MLGRDHLLLSVATVSLILAPLFTLYPNAVLVALVGASIGSLIPDADSPDAAIFHTEVRGLRGSIGKVLNSFGVLYPIFGYITKYLIYKPAVKFYDTVVFDEKTVVERHRGFLHSFLGLGTATVLTGVYLLPILYAVELFSVMLIGVFLLAYLVGSLLHLLEDSCTRSGIQWGYPLRQWRVRGRLKTTPRLEDVIYQRVFILVLGGSVVVLFFLPSNYPGISPMVFAAIGLFSGSILWALFSRYAARCEVVGIIN